MKIKNKIKSLLRKSSYKYNRLINNDKNIYLIYTMGKVGSAGIYKSLKKELPYSNIFHVHFLSKNWLDNILPNRNKLFHSNIKIGYDILNFIKKNPKKRIKIITLVREPIMRSISDLFQNWQHLYDDIETVDNQILQNRLEEMNHDYTLNWFDSEFLEYLDIDIYKHPFNKTKGFEIYNFDNIDILCIKLESLNTIGQIALHEFLKMDIILESANKSADKKGKEAYSYLNDNIKIKKEKLSELYNSKYVRHFYSNGEINYFIERWSK